ncbi:MAG: superoxide dismutase family protein [Acidobacteriota bacterium]
MLATGLKSVVLVLAAAGIPGCAAVQTAADRVASATVDFADASGATRGSGLLWQDPLGVVHVDLQLVGITPGTHGIHFHAVGRCDADFTSAGAHYNPMGRRHGLSAADGPHAGDAPNFTAGADGRARVRLTTDRVTLTSGATSLADSDGSALVVHAAADDQVTDPSGNSGARIACGVIRAP